MCTPFLVYTYVIQTYYCVMTVHFSLYFQSEVYTNSIHSLGLLQHYNSLNFTGILHILAQCCLDDGHIKEHLLHLIWIHGNYHLDGNQGYRCFITFVIACLCHDCD